METTRTRCDVNDKPTYCTLIEGTGAIADVVLTHPTTEAKDLVLATTFANMVASPNTPSMYSELTGSDLLLFCPCMWIRLCNGRV